MRSGRHLHGAEAGLWHAAGLARAGPVKPMLVCGGLTTAQAGEGEGCEGCAHGLVSRRLSSECGPSWPERLESGRMSGDHLAGRSDRSAALRALVAQAGARSSNACRGRLGSARR